MAGAAIVNPMIPAVGDPSTYPIDPSLPDLVNDQPWKVSPELFARVQAEPFAAGLQHKTCEVRPEDREYEFVKRAFEHSKPPATVIRKVTLIHNPGLATRRCSLSAVVQRR